MVTTEQLTAWAAQGHLWLWLAVLCCLALWEAFRPERRRESGRLWRWATNLGLELFNGVLMGWIALYAITVAVLQALGNPHTNVFEPLQLWGGPWAVLVAGCLLLDLVSYLVHRLEHGVFALWCIHAVHHSDVDVDASTSVRHHPLEILLSGVIALPLVLMLGIPLWVPLIFGVLVQIAQVMQHANWRLPERLEDWLSLVLMTPGVHRAHHATTAQYYDTNFGTVLSVWDRLFSTLGPRLPHGPAAPTFGVTGFRGPRYTRPDGALLLPFVMWRDGNQAAASQNPKPTP
jgi:sterol desaturase/sphingolipid hydroxylase (fatty acid hydroxylase superfamily)